MGVVRVLWGCKTKEDHRRGRALPIYDRRCPEQKHGCGRATVSGRTPKRWDPQEIPPNLEALDSKTISRFGFYSSGFGIQA